MDVISLSPLRAGSVLWRPRPDRWTLTVVCKATYVLALGESTLAPDQEPIRERDVYWDEDPRRSVYAPSDLAPFKPRADVVLVGHAYAPRSEVVRSLTARLIAGEMEKAVEVFCARVLGREGDLREGQRWNKMPLRYEYAAGGLSTWNPVGIGPGAPADPYGQRPLPNLQPPGLRVTQWSDIFVPAGFGPLSPSWRIRREKLGRRAEGWSDEGWPQIALDDDFDGDFFQVALPDQQLDALRDDERIVLEYLNADHPSLATKLPGLHPHAFVEIPGTAARDLVMTADTLWIDTDRALCTLTWRGQVAVDGPDQPGRVLIALENAGQHLTWAAIAGDRTGEVASSDASSATADHTATPVYGQPQVRRVAPTLPFLPSDPSPTPAAGAALPKPAPPGVTRDDEIDSPDTPQQPQVRRQTLQMVMEVPPAPPGPLPMWVGRPAVEPPVIATATEATQVSIAVDALRASAAARAASAGRGLELVWFSPKLAGRMRGLSGVTPTRPEGEEPSAERDVVRALVRATPDAVDLERDLFDSTTDAGALSPPVRVLVGEISFPFDEVEALRVLLVAARPSARGDGRLAEQLDLAGDMLKLDLPVPPEVAADLAASIRQTWAEASPTLPADHLAQRMERALLARRCYQRRAVLGGQWLRALFTPAGAQSPAPAYLPASLASRLPLFPSFTARMIADVLPRQDVAEESPVALRVGALAREIARLEE